MCYRVQFTVHTQTTNTLSLWGNTSRKCVLKFEICCKRSRERNLQLHISENLIPIFRIPTGVAAILAQFPNHFRSIAWFNVILGVGYIFLQLVMLRGESSSQCENPCQKHKCPLPERSKFRRMMTCSNLLLILVSLN